jgi:enoyl-CoA hydratase/carnithine racemase
LIFTGARLDVATAERWGLVNEVAPRESAMARALELARAIAGRAPISVQVAKQAIDGGVGFATGVTLRGLLSGATSTAIQGHMSAMGARQRRRQCRRRDRRPHR